MKQSTLIKMILDDDKVYDSIISAEEYMDVQYTIKLIITKAEELGMLPPYKDGEEPFGYNEGFIKAPHWEDEDETK